MLEAQQWYSNVLFSQGVAPYVLVFSFPTSNQDFRNGHSGLTSICLIEEAISELEITSLIHQENKWGGFFLSFSSCWAFLVYLNSHCSSAMHGLGTGWWEMAFFCITWGFLFCFLLLWRVLLWFFSPHPIFLPINLSVSQPMNFCSFTFLTLSPSHWMRGRVSGCVGLCCQPGWNHGKCEVR